jgi:hypothetical protein
MRAGGIRGGGGYRLAGGARPSHPIAGRPIAGRPGAPGRPIAGVPGRPIAGYPGYVGAVPVMEPLPSVPQRWAPDCMATTTTTITAATRTPTAIGSARVRTRIIGSEVERARRLRRSHAVATLAPDPLIAFAISATGEAQRIADSGF